VSRPEDWRWSSVHDYTGTINQAPITPSGVAQTYAFFAFVCVSSPGGRCECFFAWRQIRVRGSAGNDTRSTDRPLGVIGAWSMLPA